jgi:hypothetical protein
LFSGCCFSSSPQRSTLPASITCVCESAVTHRVCRLRRPG